MDAGSPARRVLAAPVATVRPRAAAAASGAERDPVLVNNKGSVPAADAARDIARLGAAAAACISLAFSSLDPPSCTTFDRKCTIKSADEPVLLPEELVRVADAASTASYDAAALLRTDELSLPPALPLRLRGSAPSDDCRSLALELVLIVLLGLLGTSRRPPSADDVDCMRTGAAAFVSLRLRSTAALPCRGAGVARAPAASTVVELVELAGAAALESIAGTRSDVPGTAAPHPTDASVALSR